MGYSAGTVQLSSSSAEQIFRVAFEQQQTATCIVDNVGTCLQVNSAWNSLFESAFYVGCKGYKSLKQGGNLFNNSLFCSPQNREQLIAALREGESGSSQFQLLVPTEAGLPTVYDVSVDPLRLSQAYRPLYLIRCFHRFPTASNGYDSQDFSPGLTAVLSHTTIPLLVKDLSGNYLMANAGIRKLFDWYGPVGELCDAKLFDPVTVNRMREKDQDAIRKEAILWGEEALIFRESQSVLTVHSLRFPILNNQGSAVATGVILMNKALSRPVEASAITRNNELQLLLDSMRSAIWYTDCQGQVKLINQQAQKLFSLGNCYGQRFCDIAPFWDDPAGRQHEIMQVIKTGEAHYNTRESCTLSYQRHWFHVDKIPTQNEHGVTGVLLLMNEITETVKQEQALQESEERYRSFIASSSQGVFRYDVFPPMNTDSAVIKQVDNLFVRARLAECNQMMAKLLGFRCIEDVLGLELYQGITGQLEAEVEQFIRNNYRLENQQIVIPKPGASTTFLQLNMTGVIEDNHLVRLWGSAQDVTERECYMDRLEYQATHDSLTDLPNRSFLYREVQAALKSTQPGQKHALMIIDLDRFREINDTLGHHTGDDVLRQLGPRINDELSDTPSLLARLGGDEFAVLLTNVRNNQHAMVTAHRLLDAIGEPFQVDGYNTEISASIGIAIAPVQADDLATLMRYADVAMYHAKAAMKGVAIYDADQDRHSRKRLVLINDLGRSLRENHLQLYYQPKLDLINKRIYGFEALLRWNHPEMGLIPPSEFIPLAEASSLIHNMTLWVLEASIEQCFLWRQQGHHFSVAVNLSVRNLLDDEIPESIELLLQKYQLPPECLELEITESSIMADPPRALKALNKIHALGIELAVDDFGTGYSSLAYLKKLPVSQLKIDYSFVVSMLEDSQDEVIVHSTINLAHNLGLTVIAEGVESSEHVKRLTELGCDKAQGFQIGRPMPASSVLGWLEGEHWKLV